MRQGVPTTSVGAGVRRWGEMGAKGSKREQGEREGVRQGVPTTSVGARGEMGVRGSETGVPTTSVKARGKMGARGSEGSKSE